MRFTRVAPILVLVGALLGTTMVVTGGQPATAAGTKYYVNCQGDDAQSGRSGARAWRTLDRANDADLQPGDALLIKRGCVFNNQRLRASWRGTAANPIKISTYGGSGSKPVIRGDNNSSVLVTGSHLVIRNLDIGYSPSETVTVNGCAQPVDHFYGINFTDGAHHNLLTKSVVRNAAAGVHLSKHSHHNRVIDNTIRNNNVMTNFGGPDPTKDLGAWGILVRSDDNEIGYNRLENNVAKCLSANGRRHSNSVEIFEGQRNYIHHNKSFGDRVFSELGGSAGNRAADNVFEFNLMKTNRKEARFITTRGSASGWGPVYRTIAQRNTIFLTGPESVAVSCGQGCNTGILSLKGNIIVSTEKVLYCSPSCDARGNVYWHPFGQPTRVQANGLNKLYDAGDTLANGSVVANPKLTNPGNDNFRPWSSSPAVNRGWNNPVATTDLAKKPSTKNGKRDAGAYEVA